MPRTADADRRPPQPPMRDRLYQAAVELFAERGYEDTTMADIALRAGVSRRSAFNHFPRKSDIPMLWTRRMADAALLEGVDPTQDARGDSVREYFRAMCRMVEAERELSRQMMLGWVSAAGPIFNESTLLPDLDQLLTQGRAAGWVATDVDLVVTAHTLSDVLMGATFRWVSERRPSTSLETEVDQGVELVLRALRPGR